MSCNQICFKIERLSRIGSTNIGDCIRTIIRGVRKICSFVLAGGKKDLFIDFPLLPFFLKIKMKKIRAGLFKKAFMLFTY